MATNNPITRITLFGALEIAHGSAAPLRPPTQRVLALLGYLIAHHDVPQARDKLVDLLWPDLLPRQGRRMLSDTLWRARRLLTPPGQDDTPALLIAGDTVAFRPDPSTWVDLIAFEQALHASKGCRRSSDERLRAAVELYRGDFLEDCYDDWALFERERLREQYLSALQRLLAADQARQAYDLALQSALRLVQADPLREEAHRALMRLYHLLGRTDDALRAFAQCRALLDTELGVEPEAETLSLYEELRALQQRRSGAGTPATRLPIEASILQDVPLVGRAGARAEVMEAIEQALVGAGGLVLLAGEAGQGKSRLLREVAAGATWRGAQVSWGRGREDAQARPFGALREALRDGAHSLTRAPGWPSCCPRARWIRCCRCCPSWPSCCPSTPFRLHEPGEQPVAALHAATRERAAGAGPDRAAGADSGGSALVRPRHARCAGRAAAGPARRARAADPQRSGRGAGRPPAGLGYLAAARPQRAAAAGRAARAETKPRWPSWCGAPCACSTPRRASARAWLRPPAATRFSFSKRCARCYEQGTLRRDEQGIWHTPWDTSDSDYQELPLPAGLRQAIDGRLRKLPPQARALWRPPLCSGRIFPRHAGAHDDRRHNQRPRTSERP